MQRASSSADDQDCTVAVIIPAYNAEASISRALHSVLAQTKPINEIVIVDDGSSDETAAIVSAFAPNVRLVTQPNSGPSRARNLGVSLTKSRYLAFLDHDDSWHPTKIEQQLLTFRLHPEAVLCYTGLTVLDEHGCRTETKPADPEELHVLLRASNPSIPPSCTMVLRSAFERVGGFNEAHRGCEDWELWFRLLQLGPFCCVQQPLTEYQVSSTGVSGNADHMYRDFEQMLDRVLLKEPLRMRQLWRRRILSTQAFHAALTARSAGQPDRDLAYHLRSIALWPSPFWEPRRFRTFAYTLYRYCAALRFGRDQRPTGTHDSTPDSRFSEKDHRPA